MTERSYTFRPGVFYAVTNAIMWASWLTVAYYSYRPGGGPQGVVAALELIGLFSPMAVALWMVFTSGDVALKKNFIDKLLNVRLIQPWTIPLIFLLVPAAIVVSVVLSHLLFKEPLGQLAMVTSAPFLAGIIPAQALLVLAPVIEEIGWKGYGMESLRGRRSFLSATLIFAALWAFWHGPTFFVRDYYQNMLVRTNPLYALNFIVSFFPATIIFNWLWYRNRGSILTAILCHGVIDLQGMLQMGQVAKCIETAVLAVVAFFVVRLDRETFGAAFFPTIGYFGRAGQREGRHE